MINIIFSTSLSKAVLFWVIIFFTAVLAVVFLYALYYRIRNNQIEEAMSRLIPVFKNLTASVRSGSLSDDQIKEILLTKDFRYFERYLRITASDITNTDASAEQNIADVTGFSEYLRHRAVNLKGWKQALTLRTLSYFRSRDNAEIFRSAIRTSRFSPSILAAGLGLALCDDYDAMGEVFKKIYETTSSNEDVLLMIISAYGDDSAEHVHNLVNKKNLNINERCIMVDALGIFRHKPSVGLLKELLVSNISLELSLHCMDALKFIGDSSIVRELMPYLNHSDYQMRVKAALTICILGGAEYIQHIEPLMQDRKWWVRRNAAEAILNTGQKGLRRLKEIAKSGEEFPKTAAQLVLTDLQFNKLGLMVNE